MKTFLLFFISCYCTIALSQSELEEIRDNSYGMDGIVDLHAMGMEDCDLITTDELYNQYVINYTNSNKTIEIIKLQENGSQVMDYGINGKVTIDSVYVQRLMLTKTHEQKLYLLAEDRDTMFLYAFTPEGQLDPEFNQGERIVATKLKANYNFFAMDIMDEVIKVASVDRGQFGGTYHVPINQFSLAGVQLALDTIPLSPNPYLYVDEIHFRPSDEIYVVYGDNDESGEAPKMNIRRFKNITLDTTFANHGTYAIPTEDFDNIYDFKLVVQEDQLTISYLFNTFKIKHERLNLSGELLYENFSLVIDADNEFFAYMDRSDIAMTNDGYFVMENVVDELLGLTYYFTKYNHELEVDSTFGQDGRYVMYRIPRWRTVDDLNRIYMTIRTSGYFALIRTDRNEISAIDKIDDKHNNIKIYPNPTNSTVRIYSDDTFQDDILCKIYDISGHLMHAQRFGNLDFKLDLYDYEPGAYIIKLVSSTKSLSKVIFKY